MISVQQLKIQKRKLVEELNKIEKIIEVKQTISNETPSLFFDLSGSMRFELSDSLSDTIDSMIDRLPPILNLVPFDNKIEVTSIIPKFKSTELSKLDLKKFGGGGLTLSELSPLISKGDFLFTDEDFVFEQAQETHLVVNSIRIIKHKFLLIGF